jgi:predicted  nucleic acid-binding Zn-ribbon protein
VEDITSLEDLLDLQSVDSEIDRLLDRRGSLVELEAYRGAHRLLTRLDGEIAAAEGTLRELDLAEDRAEGEMNLDEEKLVREERRLYAGNLSARDATNLRDEVEMLRKRVSTREDEALGLIEQREQGQDTVDRLHKERTSTLAEKGRLEAVIAAAWAEIDADMARLEAKKAEIVPRCDPELVRLYEEIRPSKEGVAVTTLVDGVCGGCHLRLSAAEESQALRAFPPRCHHCRRILAPR